jgi:hypothetical protein
MGIFKVCICGNDKIAFAKLLDFWTKHIQLANYLA